MTAYYFYPTTVLYQTQSLWLKLSKFNPNWALIIRFVHAIEKLSVSDQTDMYLIYQLFQKNAVPFTFEKLSVSDQTDMYLIY